MNTRVEALDRWQKPKNYPVKSLKIRGLGCGNRFGCCSETVLHIYNPQILYYSFQFPKQEHTCKL